LLSHAFDETLRLMERDRLGAWVVDTAAEVKLWRDRGIRQITTNRPDIAVKAMELP
jgi:glycerophosphoryl diester phosphodiesterase